MPKGMSKDKALARSENQSENKQSEMIHRRVHTRYCHLHCRYYCRSVSGDTLCAAVSVTAHIIVSVTLFVTTLS